MSDYWTNETKLVLKLRPFLKSDDPVEIDSEDFKLLMSLAEDGLLVKHRHLDQIIEKIMPSDEFDMIDVEEWRKVGRDLISIVAEMSVQVNRISRQLSMQEGINKILKLVLMSF